MKLESRYRGNQRFFSGEPDRKALLLVFLSLAAACVLFLLSCGDIRPPNSPYLSTVFEYQYGPGQHASSIDQADAESCVGEPDSTALLLGGWGGYVIAGFDHVVANTDGFDFAVIAQGGFGSEPGVVFVMEDTDKNGMPDETWYELSGSETGSDYSAETGNPLDRYIRDYEVTYTKAASAMDNVAWMDNQGNSGELVCGYPEGSTSASWWLDDWGDSLTLSGVKLPDCRRLSGSSWVDYDNRFTSGYAENYGGTDYADLGGYSVNRFDISDAVDAVGNPVPLDGIVFIRIQTGVFQQTGNLNEVSTEIRGAVDLSLVDWED